MSQTHKDNPMLGMSAAIGAFFLLGVMQMFGKILSDHYHVIEIGFFRNLIGVIPFALYVFTRPDWRDILTIKERKGAVLTRAVLGTISLIITFAAFAAMPMADTTAFIFASSLMIPILSYFFLKEQVGPYRWGAIVIGFIGVLIMVQPTGAVNIVGICLALTAAFMHAILGVLIRYAGQTERAITITFYFLLIGIFVAALGLPFVWVTPAPEHYGLFIAVALSGAAAQGLLSIAFKYAEASIVTVFNYSGIIWATSFGWLIWGDFPTLAIWIGASIVISANLFIIWRERRFVKRT